MISPDDIAKPVIIGALSSVVAYFGYLLAKYAKTIPGKLDAYGLAWWNRACIPIIEKLDFLEGKIACVEREVLKNGGQTLRDAVTRVEESLQKTTAVNKAMLGFHDENRGWFQTNAKGELTWISAQILRWVRRSHDEVIGYGSGHTPRWLSIIAPENQHEALRWWNETHSSGAESSMHQVYISATRERINVVVYATPVFSNGGRDLLAYVGMIIRVGDSAIPTERDE